MGTFETIELVHARHDIQEITKVAPNAVPMIDNTSPAVARPVGAPAACIFFFAIIAKTIPTIPATNTYTIEQIPSTREAIAMPLPGIGG